MNTNDRRFAFFSVLAGVILMAALAGPAAAADDEGEGDPARLGEIVVEGRGENLVGIAESSSEGKVGREVLDNRPLLRTGELLETVPGMIVTQHSGDGKANQYFLRGFNLDHGTDFRTTVDGMPVNMPTHAHGQGYTDLNFVIPELIHHIDYKKGVYFAEEGDFSAAGAAHLSLMDSLPKRTVQSSYGEYAFFREVAIGSEQAGAGNLVYGLEAGYSNGPWDLKQDANRYNGTLRYVSGDKRNGYSLTAMGYHSFWNSSDQIPDRAVDAGLISDFGRIDPTDGGRTSRYSISGQWHDLRGENRWRANAYAISYQLNLFSNFTYFLDNPERGDQFEQADRRVVFGGESSLERDSELFGAKGKNTFGFQLRNDVIPSVALRKTQRREEYFTTRDDKVYEGSVALYTKNETEWTETLRTNVGVRGDLFEFNVNSSNDANSGNEVAGKVSPKAGVVLGPWAETEFYGNAGLGFHSNDARGTTISEDPSTGEPSTPVNPLVLARGAEVGIRTAAVPDLNTTLSFWILDLSSELLFVGDAGLTEPNRASRRMGIELANFYKPLSWLAIDADYSLSRARFREDDPAGDYVPGSIENVLATGITATSKTGLFSSFRIRYFGPRPLIEDNSVRSQKTLLANARAGYALGDLKFTLDVLNVFDSNDHDIDYFYGSRLPGEPDGGVDDIHFHPVEPREFRGTISYSF